VVGGIPRIFPGAMAVHRQNLEQFPEAQATGRFALMDIFGPPYAHYHSLPEVTGWFQAHGFTDVWSCDHSRRGFAVCGHLADR
jgi:hypothetical protein